MRNHRFAVFSIGDIGNRISLHFANIFLYSAEIDVRQEQFPEVGVGHEGRDL